MRSRLALAAALLAGAAAAVPAHAAAYLYDCGAHLANAATGDVSTCFTQGPPPVECNGCGVRRTADIVVATGGVDATLSCDGWQTYTTHVDAGERGVLSLWGGQLCYLRLVATADGTTAVGTSTADYVVIAN